MRKKREKEISFPFEPKDLQPAKWLKHLARLKDAVSRGGLSSPLSRLCFDENRWKIASSWEPLCLIKPALFPSKISAFILEPAQAIPETPPCNCHNQPHLMEMESNPPANLEKIASEIAILISQRLLEVPPDFNSSSNLFDLGLDSMAIMQMLLLIDENYGIWLEPSDLTRENFNTPLTIAQLLQGRLGVPPSTQ